MKTGLMKVLAVVFVAAFAGAMVGGCGPDEEELALQNQIGDQIKVIDDQVKGLDQHQAKLREMIKEMQTQLDALSAELDKESPKIVAAGDGLLRLRELTTVGFGLRPGAETIENPSFSYGTVMVLLLFLLLVWVLYRMRHRSNSTP